ncbi:magnesium transporter [Lentilitoribacter sp. Alg239-R112]|uniref:magnesium transporter n=1 Tax=Lentilitoribacter sp. Alg239-R112 TaxID=2305987 RepID=UPI0013A6B280|nr:magnesium transporter [Lentilitoribacter sp. Alg239-R112]
MVETDSHNDQDVDIAVKTLEDSHDNGSIYDDEGRIRSDFRKTVGRALDSGNIDHLNGLVAALHESEMGDLLESLKPRRRQKLVEVLGDSFDFAALTEVDEAIRVEIVDYIPNKDVARRIGELDSDDAVFILEDLEASDRDAILAELPFIERVRLRRSLEYPEDSAGRRMQSEFVAVPPFWTVGQTIDYMRIDKDLPESFSQIFVIDATYKLVGSIDLDKILRTKRQVRTEEILNDTIHPIPALMDQEEAALVFEQYDLLSAAVIDHNERLVGVLTIDDVVDVINEEAEEDIKALAGVGDEELSDNVFAAFRSRFAWLLINLLTSIGASMVIGAFDATIQQMVALAVLMPIVASMGGNAGTQTMTVTVRALATRDLDIYNTGRIIQREALVGAVNGVLFAALIGVVAAFWFDNIDLGFVIGIAMIINMISAALAGILLPLMLDKLGVDPAISSTVFVTTVTDVVGFFAFLGLAGWWFSFL